MFFVKFGPRPDDPIWPVDLFEPQTSEAADVLGALLADATQGFPVPFYPLCLQKAHENAALVDFDFDVIQDLVFDGIRSKLGDEALVWWSLRASGKARPGVSACRGRLRRRARRSACWPMSTRFRGRPTTAIPPDAAAGDAAAQQACQHGAGSSSDTATPRGCRPPRRQGSGSAPPPTSAPPPGEQSLSMRSPATRSPRPAPARRIPRRWQPAAPLRTRGCCRGCRPTATPAAPPRRSGHGRRPRPARTGTSSGGAPRGSPVSSRTLRTSSPQHHATASGGECPGGPVRHQIRHPNQATNCRRLP